MSDELKITTGLQEKLEAKGIDVRLDELIKYKETVDKFLSQNTLTKEQRETITKKFYVLSSVYAELYNINKNRAHYSNEKKAERMAKALEVVPADFLNGIDKEIESVEGKISYKCRKVKENVKDIFAKAQEQMSEFVESHVTQKQEEIKQVEKEETALIKSPEKKGALKRLFAILGENSKEWHEVKQKDGTIKLVNADGEVRAVVDTKDAPHGAEIEQRVLDARRSFGFFSKLKTFYEQEKAGSKAPSAEGKEQKAKAKDTIKKIKEHGKDIADSLEKAEKGAVAHVEAREEQAKKGGRGITAIKTLLQAFEYNWENIKDSASILWDNGIIIDAKDDEKEAKQKLAQIQQKEEPLYEKLGGSSAEEREKAVDQIQKLSEKELDQLNKIKNIEGKREKAVTDKKTAQHRKNVRKAAKETVAEAKKSRREEAAQER